MGRTRQTRTQRSWRHSPACRGVVPAGLRVGRGRGKAHACPDLLVRARDEASPPVLRLGVPRGVTGLLPRCPRARFPQAHGPFDISRQDALNDTDVDAVRLPDVLAPRRPCSPFETRTRPSGLGAAPLQ